MWWFWKSLLRWSDNSEKVRLPISSRYIWVFTIGKNLMWMWASFLSKSNSIYHFLWILDGYNRANNVGTLDLKSRGIFAFVSYFICLFFLHFALSDWFDIEDKRLFLLNLRRLTDKYRGIFLFLLFATSKRQLISRKRGALCRGLSDKERKEKVSLFAQ
jgi:hypothetical protein